MYIYIYSTRRYTRLLIQSIRICFQAKRQGERKGNLHVRRDAQSGQQIVG